MLLHRFGPQYHARSSSDKCYPLPQRISSRFSCRGLCLENMAPISDILNVSVALKAVYTNMKHAAFAFASSGDSEVSDGDLSGDESDVSIGFSDTATLRSSGERTSAADVIDVEDDEGRVSLIAVARVWCEFQRCGITLNWQPRLHRLTALDATSGLLMRTLITCVYNIFAKTIRIHPRTSTATQPYTAPCT